MPTVPRKNGFRFQVFTEDHIPDDQDQAVLIASAFQDYLLAEWRRIHG